MKDFLTVKEIAKELNVSTQAVYNRLERDLKPYLKVLNGQKMISIKALKDFDATKINNELNAFDKQEQRLDKIIELLESQLNEKDRQIEKYSERLKELNNTIIDLSQRISEANQIIYSKQLEYKPIEEAHQEKAITIDEEVKNYPTAMKDQVKKKTGFLKKLFNKEGV